MWKKNYGLSLPCIRKHHLKKQSKTNKQKTSKNKFYLYKYIYSNIWIENSVAKTFNITQTVVQFYKS